MAQNEKNLNSNKRKTHLPNVVFYIVVSLFLIIGVVALIILVIFFFIENKSGNTKELHAIAIGIAGSLFSGGILLNAIGSHLSSRRSYFSNLKESRLKLINDIVREYNYEVITLYNFTKCVQTSARTALKKAKLDIISSLTVQEDAVKNFENAFENEDEYIDSLIRSTILFLSFEKGSLDDKYLDYLNKVYSGNPMFPLNKNKIGCAQVLRIYHERRIKVLNFFENIAIQYMNELIDRDLFDAQFKSIIIDIINLFYYDIYKKEGNVSYPSLLMLCEIYRL